MYGNRSCFLLFSETSICGTYAVIWHYRYLSDYCILRDCCSGTAFWGVRACHSISFPLSITACICFGILCSKYCFSETAAIILCIIWSAVWLFIILNESLYKIVAVPIWFTLLGFAILFLVFAVCRILKSCNKYLEVPLDEIRT